MNERILYHIRKAEPGDVNALAELDQRCFASPWSRQSFEEEVVKNPLALYLVAEGDHGELLGYAGVWMIAGEGHITNVAASPEHRRCGIARGILTQLFEICETRHGIEAFTLEVRPSNAPALALYQSFGFEAAGRRKGYYEDNVEDALIMWRQVVSE